MMAGVNHASQKFRSLTKLANGITSYKYPNSVSRCLNDIADTQFRVKDFQSLVHNRSYTMKPISAFSHRCLMNNGSMNLHSWNPSYVVSISSMNRKYSSFFGNKGEDGGRESEVLVPSVASQSNVDSSNVDGSDWSANLKNVWQSTVDAAVYTREKAEVASNEITPHVQQLFDTYPYLRNIIVPVGGTLTGTWLAWWVMPKVLRKLHKYSLTTANSSPLEQVPYEKSFWGALEDPVRYLVTFVTFSYIGTLIAPTTITPQYITEAWRGAAILSFVWFLHRWKTNVFARALGSQNIIGLDREKLLVLDKLSSVGLFILGLMALAEACGVAVQSVLTVGGIGGVATAFAAKDILGNVLSGLSMQFSKPFSLGDTIKAGTIEGQVIEMGLTTTLLLNAERFPVTVPNSLFSNQVIVNKSRAQMRAIWTKVPLRIVDLDKIPQISDDIKSMLRSNAKTFMEKEAPYCFISRVENYYAELTIGYNLQRMSKDELYSTQQDILLQAAQIIKKHGATLGNTTDTGPVLSLTNSEKKAQISKAGSDDN